MQQNKSHSVDCRYKKVQGDYLHIGNLYFINRTIVSKQTDDRDFLYRIIAGKQLVDDMDDIYYNPLSTVFRDHEHRSIETEEAEKVIHTSASEHMRNIYKNTLVVIKRVNDKAIKQSREALDEAVQNSKPSEHVKHILTELNKGITSPQHFSMHEYLNIITAYILDKPHNKYKQGDIMMIVQYLVLCFVPRDENDFPAVKINISQLRALESKTVNMSEGHPFKWDSKRIALLEKQPTAYRKQVYLNDFLYLWKLYIVSTTPIQELTDADIRVKYIVDTLLQKLSFEYSTEIIILHKMQEVHLKRLKKVFQEIFRTMQNQMNTKYFSTYNHTDVFLENQLKYQYVLNIKDAKHAIEAKAKTKGSRRATAQEVITYLRDNKLMDEVKLL